MADFTVEIGTSVNGGGGGGAITPAIPGDGSAGKLLILVAQSNNQAAVVDDDPSGEGFTELADSNQGGKGWPIIYGKISTGSDTDPTFNTDTGVNAGFVLAITSTTGWPAIGSVLAGSSSSGAQSDNNDLTYFAHTQITAGNFGLQAACGSVNSTAQTLSSIDVTSGFDAAGFHGRSGVAGGLAIAAQSQKMAGNMSSNTENVNTNTNNFTNRGATTVELSPAADVAVPGIQVFKTIPPVAV